MPVSLPSSPAWLAFAEAAKTASRTGDRLRIIEAAGLRIDVTAQAQSDELDTAGEALLAQQGFNGARAALYGGQNANWTEQRPAWHTALRAAEPPAAVRTAILSERERVRHFTNAIEQSGQYTGVLHLGIGGSDWGPRMVTRALRHAGLRRNVQFVSNIDSHAATDAFLQLDPRKTLVIIASKSFTTAEPLANAEVAMQWMRDAGVENPRDHVVAITANVDAALAFGIAPEHIFRFWDWVGGRYSLWSAIGLPIALALGNNAFDELLAGAADMDSHFLHAPTQQNAPLQMALSGIANRSVLGYATLAITPYDSRLFHLVPWAQQLEMESLGKVATLDGSPVGVPTGPVVWGMSGTDCQHTFFQWLHQDTTGAPVDFIACEQPDHSFDRYHSMLIANCLAQRSALLRGKSYEEALAEVSAKESDPDRAAQLARHLVHPGGRPSTFIMLPQLTAHSMGALLALYEHKVFAQGAIWGINPFDQWGVEFGKRLAQQIVHELDAPTNDAPLNQDPSTGYWINTLRQRNTPSN